MTVDARVSVPIFVGPVLDDRSMCTSFCVGLVWDLRGLFNCSRAKLQFAPRLQARDCVLRLDLEQLTWCPRASQAFLVRILPELPGRTRFISATHRWAFMGSSRCQRSRLRRGCESVVNAITHDGRRRGFARCRRGVGRFRPATRPASEVRADDSGWSARDE